MNMMALPMATVGALPAPGSPLTVEAADATGTERTFVALLNGNLQKDGSPAGLNPDALAQLAALLANQQATPQQDVPPGADGTPPREGAGLKPPAGRGLNLSVQAFVIQPSPQTATGLTTAVPAGDDGLRNRATRAATATGGKQPQLVIPPDLFRPEPEENNLVRIVRSGVGRPLPLPNDREVPSPVGPSPGSLPPPVDKSGQRQTEPVMSLTEKRFARLLGDQERPTATTAGVVRPAARADQPASSPAAEQTAPRMPEPAPAPAPDPAGRHAATDPTAQPLVVAPATARSDTPPQAPATPAARPGSDLHPGSGGKVAERVVVEQVVSHFGRTGKLESGQASLRLYPEELGEVRLDIDIRDNRVSATLQAQSHQVQDVLNRHLDSLRQALEHQGLRVDRIEVRVAAESPPAAGHEQAFTGHFSGQQFAGHFFGQSFQRSGHQSWQSDFDGWPPDTPEHSVEPEPVVNRPAQPRAGLSLRV